MTAQAHATVLDPVRPRPRSCGRSTWTRRRTRPGCWPPCTSGSSGSSRPTRPPRAATPPATGPSPAVATALATHVAVEDELVYLALRDHTGRHDAEVERQLQQDHLLDLVMVELGAWSRPTAATTARSGC